ncbi:MULTISPECIES: hypothetical protein [unclassified Pseudomonas]|uniref:hypothetical protein n=1 Tax=unclassified Pseudomonas TaxID=196821 RepID=UPI00244AB9F4|nr:MULTISPECIES: hypothetical protein [unclassified Pseudomonas]MDH0894221.1 hypothetical protein [Pseudomonas sp. GD03875]MDH1063484.1 hypothetical protein [Pseudomonas sp. GD03985]
MTLIAYALGQNIVAAARPADAAAVMDVVETPGKWRPEDARKLTAKELSAPVDDSSAETIAEALARMQLFGDRAQLIRWDYPAV